MKISYEWLREYLNTKIRAENLSSFLTMAGHEVTSIEQRDKDFIFEIEITPNRPDCLCHIGIAREAAAIIKKDLRLPRISLPAVRSKRPLEVSIEDQAGCPRYSGRIITGAKVAASPRWLIKRIEAMGLRPVNNIVDITNFTLFEMGQPLHAFDLDKISGAAIIVRRARPGEKILTIDGIERALEPHTLVIADDRKPVAIAGVMGGKETEVTEQTKNILLESAYFDPVSIRNTAFFLGLGSDSSYRFERGVDLTAVVSASDRAAALVCEIARASLGNIVDAGKKTKDRGKISLRPAKLNTLLGIKLTPQKIKDILLRLGFSCKGTSILEVSAPGFRHDVTREADLIEEVARIYGYENIPSLAPAAITTDEDSQSKDAMEKRGITKRALTSLGFNEIITYSLISKQAADSVGIPEEGTIEIKNPLSREQEIMRQSLLPGMVKTVSYNIGRQIHDINLFELSNIYFTKEGLYNEEPFLALAQCTKDHKEKSEDYSTQGIFRLKAAIVVLGKKLGIVKLGFERTTHPLFAPEETLAALSGDTMLGTIGRIRPEVLKGFDIKTELYAAELNFKKIVEASSLSRLYRPLPRFPFSYRDISFAIERGVSYKEITSLIKSAGGLLVEDIELLSEYRGEQIQKGHRGLAIRIVYRSKEKTLTEEEVNKIDGALRENLTKNFKAILR